MASRDSGVGRLQVAKVPFLADASTGVGRPLEEPVSFRADVRSGSTDVGRLLVEPVSFRADVRSGDTLAFAACVILGSVALVGFLTMDEKCPGLLGNLHGQGDGRGSPYVALDRRAWAGKVGPAGGASRGAAPGGALFSVDTSRVSYLSSWRAVGRGTSPASAWSIPLVRPCRPGPSSPTPPTSADPPPRPMPPRPPIHRLRHDRLRPIRPAIHRPRRSTAHDHRTAYDRSTYDRSTATTDPPPTTDPRLRPTAASDWKAPEPQDQNQALGSRRGDARCALAAKNLGEAGAERDVASPGHHGRVATRPADSVCGQQAWKSVERLPVRRVFPGPIPGTRGCSPSSCAARGAASRM
jgi:hypothetical protein